MKKITLWLFALFTCWQINAQVSSYGFSQSAGAYTEITGGTVLGTATNDDTSFPANPIGFSFYYNGANYTQFSVNSNGFLALGATVASSYTALSSGATNNVVAALNGDLQGNTTTGELSYQLSGTAPNQVLTVQWKSYRHYNVTGDNNNFQIKLYETTNVVEVVYGTFVQNATARTREVGLRGSSNADFNNRTTTTDWSATSAGAANTNNCALTTAIIPASGLTFTWTPPSCAAPGGFVASAITSSAATITWNAAFPVPSTGYEYYYSEVNTAPSGAGTATTALTANLTGLTANTLHYVWLRSDCGGGVFSNWSGPFTFTTLCNAFTAPFLYDVETAAATTNSTIGDCWSSIPTVTTAAYRWDVDAAGSTPSTGTGPSGAFSGTKYFYTEASSGGTGAIAELYTPLVNISALTEPTLQFYYHMYGVNMGELHVDVFNGTSWVNDVDVIIGQQQAAETDPWLERIVDLSAYSGTIQVRFRAIRGIGFEGDMSLDDISFDEAPACLPVTGLAVSNITSSSVQIDWNDMSGVGQFDFEYAVQVQGTGTPVGAGVALADITVIETNDITATPLAPNSPYEVYVRADCGGGLFSSWVGPVNFTTECATYAAPLLETFDTFLPACWQEADNGDLTAGPATFGTAGWFADGFGNVGFTGSIAYEIWLASANDWVISPTINIPATGYELKFDAAVTQWSTTAPPTNPWESDDFVEVLVSTTGYTNWTVLYTYNNTNVPATTGTTNILDLDAYAGQDVRFAYRVVEGTADGTTDLNFYVDNFEIRLTPSTPPLCASNVVATPDAACGNFANSITWDATVGADGYYLTIGTSTGASDVLNNADLGNVLSYSFTGTIGTTYYYTLLPYNGVGPATGCTEMSFATNANGCYCTSSPSATNFDGNGISNVLIVATNIPNAAVPYTDNTATPVDMSQGISNNVQITFETGFTYDVNIWIDFNDDFDFNDAGELVQTGIASTNANPTTLDASFVMPGSAPLGLHRMRIGTADGGQVPPNACYSGDWGVTIDYAVNIIAATCSPATIASSTIIPDCANAQFSVAVDVTALGSGSPAISDGTTSWPVAATGVINVGPFADGTSVTLTALHGSDSTCDLPLGSFTYTCPAANDNLCNAIALTVNATSTGTAYNNVGATAETNEPVAACFNNGIDGSVWFSFVAPASGEVNVTTDIAGATLTDTEIAVYDATGVTCSDLSTLGTALGCDQDGGTTINFNSFLNVAGLTPSNTYYIQVDMWGFTTNGSFGIEVAEVLASDSFDNNSFVAYPNPVKDIFNVSYSSEISSVRVINLLGQEVISNNVNATSTQIDMSQLSSGAYIVNVTVGDTIKTIKVVKQ